MENNYIVVNGELYHWGVKGMRWGVRRYQNRDGTLTKAGKKRYNKEMERLKAEEKVIKNHEQTKAKIAKLEAKRTELDARRKALDEDGGNTKTPNTKEKNAPQKKTVKDMSDAELNAIVTRLNLENRYSQLNPEKVSGGKKFADKILKDVLAPAATEVGKNYMKKLMNDLIENTTKKK